jgi:uncharacterized protein YqeY
MSLKDRIHDDIKAAMKAGDKRRRDALRLVESQFQSREVDLRGKHGVDYQIEDDEALAVIARAAKQRRESVESYRKGGREDLATGEEAELAIIEEYLPTALGEEELRAVVQEAISEAEATSPRDMGAVMRIVMPKVRGRADGKAVNEMVKSMLAS